MMDFNTVYCRTKKGESEIGKNSQSLSLDLLDVFELVDGKTTVGELIEKAPHWSSDAISHALESLLQDGLIEEASAAATGGAEFIETDSLLESHTAIEGVKSQPSSAEGSKFADSKRNVIATVLFLDIVEYTKQSVSNQLSIKEQFNSLVSGLIKNIPEADRVILDTGDGAALGFLGDPEDVLFIAINLRDALKRNDHQDFPDLFVRMGINLGPVRLVKDMTGKSNLIGDGVNDAQRVMSFARADQILVSRSFFDVVSRLSADHSGLFKYQGVHRDKHRREHEIYEIGSAEMQQEREAEAKAAAKTEEEIQAERREKLKAKLEAAARAEASAKAATQADAGEKVEIRKQAAAREAKRQEERVAAVNLKKRRASFVKPLVAAVAAALLLAGGVLPLIPLNMYIPGAEKLISERVNEPVKIDSLKVSLLPSPRFLLSGISIGSDQGIRIGSLTAITTFGSLFGESKEISEVKLKDASLNQDSLSGVSKWAVGGSIPKFDLGNVKLALADIALPAFDAQVEVSGDGKVAHASINSVDRKVNAEVTAKDGAYPVSVTAKAWQMPLGPAMVWDELHASGIATTQGIKVSEIDATGYGGSLKGALQVSWSRLWHAEGTFYGKGLELDQLTPVFSNVAKLKGSLEIRGSYALDAGRPEQLFAAPRVRAAFAVRDGEIGNVDVAAALQPGSGGGITKIGELSGVVGFASRAYQYQQLKLSSGLLKADGYLDVAADQRLSGRIGVELGPVSSPLAISGTVGEPLLHR